jgi:hypothetical protein
VGAGAAALAVEDRHLPRVVAVACHGLLPHRALDRGDIVAREFDIMRGRPEERRARTLHH